jgi:uncharacterized protein YndB with AHSA1/START domain
MNSDVKITGNRLQITRTFNAPRERVFDAWADPAKAQRWTGCKDAESVECQADFRVGGSFTTKMHIGGHANCDCTFTGIFEEIVEPQKISYQINFLNPVPAKSRVTIEFFSEGPDHSQTRMVFVQENLPAGIVPFVQQGLLESFEKLDVVLVSLSAQGASA